MARGRKSKATLEKERLELLGPKAATAPGPDSEPVNSSAGNFIKIQDNDPLAGGVGKTLRIVAGSENEDYRVVWKRVLAAEVNDEGPDPKKSVRAGTKVKK